MSRETSLTHNDSECGYPRCKWCRQIDTSTITGALQPCEGAISEYTALKLAKCSQHSADQLPYGKPTVEHSQSIFYEKAAVGRSPESVGKRSDQLISTSLLMDYYVVVSYWHSLHGASTYSLSIDKFSFQIVSDELTNGQPLGHGCHETLAMAIGEFEGGVVIISHNFHAHPVTVVFLTSYLAGS
ncbi:hypothetical protein EDC04DRAFT_2649893 [Pisolithus marmoratus]|nr:hypothetical protein EDC04DRAFT_2649893 [Pisolithus marmoratus]